MRSRPEIPPGTLYMLILKSLARIGPMHGYGIAQYIQQISENVLQVEEGSLYPALQRMLIKDWVSAEWKQSANTPSLHHSSTPLLRLVFISRLRPRPRRPFLSAARGPFRFERWERSCRRNLL